MEPGAQRQAARDGKCRAEGGTTPQAEGSVKAEQA